MKYFVTGATGFLGRHLVRTLASQGHEVIAIVRTKSDLACEQRIGDVLGELPFDGADGVFHCAGKVSRDPRDAERLRAIHVDGTKRTVDACIQHGIRRITIASTSGTVAVSENPNHVATEDDETPIGLLNRWPYYRSKLFAEQSALAKNGAPLANGALFEVVSVNPTLLLGPGDVNGSSTDDVRLFLERRIPAIPPGGLSYVDVRDAALGMILAMEKGVAGRRYLLGACNVTLREFFARLERVSGVRGPLVPMPRLGHEVAKGGAELLSKLAARFGITMPVDPVSLDMAHFYWYLDASRAETELGWQPRDPIETLADTVKDLEARGVVWPRAGVGMLGRENA